MWKVWQQLKMYKNLLIVFWLINIFAIATAGVMTYSYFNTPHSSISSKLKRASALGRLQASLSQYSASSSTKHLFHVNKSLSDLMLVPSTELPYSAKQLSLLRNELINTTITKVESLNKESESLFSDLEKKQSQLILIGALTLVFGLLLPILIISLMTKLGFMAKKKTENHIKTWILQWQEENSRYEEPFKSPEFWSRILVISLEHFAPLVDHPAAHYLSDISGEIKTEMKKTKAGTKDAEQKAA